MRILRFFLYIVLAISICWSTILFAGPAALKWIIPYYSSERVIVENVKISPQFQISFGRVNYSFDSLADNLVFSGTSRSVNVSWSLFDDNSFLKLTAGPTVFENFGRSKSIELKLPSLESFDLENLKFEASFEQLNVKSLGTFEDLEIEGNLKDDLLNLTNLSINALDLSSEDPGLLSVQSLHGELSDIKLDIPINKQSITSRFFSKQLSSQKLEFKIDDLKGDLNFRNSILGFGIEIKKFDSVSLGGKADRLGVQGVYKFGASIAPLTISLVDGLFFKDRLHVADIKAEITLSDSDSYLADVTARLNSVEFFMGETFISFLPANTLNFNLHYNVPTEKFLASAKVEFNNPELSHIAGSANLEGKIKQPSTTTDCNLLSCWLSDFNSRYRISLGHESFYGESSCFGNEHHCLLASMAHKISTTDTIKVFDELNRSKILNPLTSIFLYGAISSGRKVGRGHEININ